MSRFSSERLRLALWWEVLLAAADQVVDDAYHHAALEQQVDHVAADEAGATGNDGNWLVAHAACNAFSLRTLK
jgi:hypothetical protein